MEEKLQEDIGMGAASFILKNHGIGMVGLINDVPKNLVDRLEPKEYQGSIVIFEGAVPTIASIYKELYPLYEGVPDEDVKEAVRQDILRYQKIEAWMDRRIENGL